VTDPLERLKAALADRYTIESEIGRGGMSIVYRARDLKHARSVAIKVLRPDVAAALGSERFLREIGIAARLLHSHILLLLDSGEVDGVLYYVMPYIEGDSLRQRLIREPQLPIDETLQITREVAGALSHAHARGVVHRDIKPENILLSDGGALVADFGIAQALSSAPADQLTSTGVSIGTPAYMSPEQADGRTPLDGRADQYSLACVVYEMLAGVTPFSGPNQQALMARHAIDPVPPLRTVRATTPEHVDRAVLRALAKSPADRFPTIGDFQEELTRPAPAPARRRRPFRSGWLVAGVLVATAGVYGLLSRQSPHRGLASNTTIPSIAVLPFVNIGGDTSDEYFSDGMSEELIATLSKISDLHVAARISAFSFKHKQVTAPAIGHALQVGTLLEGTVRRSGTRVRVHAVLINTADGYQLWSDEYERDVKDVFAVQDEIAQAIVGALRLRLSDAARASLVRRPTGSPEAHDLYLQGRYFFAKRDSASLRKAQEYFARAIATDSGFALAYAGLSDCYSHRSVFGYVAPRDIYPQAKAAALHALALDSTLVEVHTSLGFVALFLEWDWATAKREFDQALALDPRYAPAHLFHGWYFVAADRVNDAVDEVRNGVRLDPLDKVTNTRLSSMLLYARRYEEALAQARLVLELDPTWFQGRVELAHAYMVLDRCGEAIATIRGMPEQTASALRGVAGLVYARCGHRSAALAELNHFLAEEKNGVYISHYSLAVIYAGLGDKAKAFTELDSAYTERTFAMFTLRVDPAFDGLRADPRFTKLLKNVGLTI
jgi:eukaryotic-like serine/threonine-protein kinase